MCAKFVRLMGLIDLGSTVSRKDSLRDDLGKDPAVSHDLLYIPLGIDEMDSRFKLILLLAVKLCQPHCDLILCIQSIAMFPLSSRRYASISKIWAFNTYLGNSK